MNIVAAGVNNKVGDVHTMHSALEYRDAVSTVRELKVNLCFPEICSDCIDTRVLEIKLPAGEENKLNN